MADECKTPRSFFKPPPHTHIRDDVKLICEMHHGFAKYKYVMCALHKMSIMVSLCPRVQDHEGQNSYAESMSAVFTAYTFLHDETQAQTSPNPLARDYCMYRWIPMSTDEPPNELPK